MSMEVNSSTAYLATPRHSWWSTQTTKEKKLLVTCAFLGVLVVVFFTCTIAFGSKKRYHPQCVIPEGNNKSKNEEKGVEMCTTKECIETAYQLKTSMNEDIKPCDNFYEFACGGFKAKNLENQSPFKQTADLLLKQIEELIRTTDPKKEGSKAVQSAIYLHRKCLDQGNDDAQSVDSLRELIEYVLGTDWPVAVGDNWKEEDFDWSLSLARLFALTSDWFRILPNKENYTELALYLPLQPLPVSLPGNIKDIACVVYPDCHPNISLDKVSNKNLLMSPSASNVGNIENSPTQDVLKIFMTEFEKVSIKDLEEKNITNVDWNNFFETLFHGTSISIDETFTLFVHLKSLPSIADFEKDKRDLANKIGFTIVEKMGKLHSWRIKKFWPADTTRPRDCLDFLLQNVGFAALKAYVDKYLPEKSLSEVTSITVALQEAFRKIVGSTPWLDEDTKNVALKKVDKMESIVASPEWVFNDDDLTAYYKSIEEAEDLPFFNTSLLATRNVVAQTLNQIGSSRKKLWLISVADVNAFYFPAANFMYYQIGILKAPFFYPGRTRAVKYGSLGFVAGHEITHGFDSKGKDYNENGQLIDWWNPESAEKFKKESKCFSEQYSAIKDNSTGLNLNGTSTLGENIADNGGIRAAYQAFLDAPTDENAVLPGLEKYTEEQVFFIATAQVWCNTNNLETNRYYIEKDEHSPPTYRAIVPFQYFPEFSKAFNCAPGSFMNPEKKCRIW